MRHAVATWQKPDRHDLLEVSMGLSHCINTEKCPKSEVNREGI